MLTVGIPLITSTKVSLILIQLTIAVAVISSVAGILVSGFNFFKIRDNFDYGSFLMCIIILFFMAYIFLMAI